MLRPTLTHPTVLRELFDYDPLTGILRWRVSPARRVAVGDEAGTLGYHGYRRVRVGRVRLPVHRVVWALHTGEWPAPGLRIDHINGIKDDNRLANLRLATLGQNRANSIAQSAHGTKGLCRERNGRWAAQIWRDGALRRLGVFDTKEEAAACFDAEHRRLYGEFSFTAAERPTGTPIIRIPRLYPRDPITGCFLPRPDQRATPDTPSVCKHCGKLYVRRPSRSRTYGQPYCVDCRDAYWTRWGTKRRTRNITIRREAALDYEQRLALVEQITCPPADPAGEAAAASTTPSMRRQS